MLSALALLGCGLASCVKEDFPDPDDNRFDTDGYSLGITIKLDDDLQTRAEDYNSSYYDNYIDTRNRLRVLFFDENGQFIFEAIDRTVMERSATDGTEWFVHIPVNYVVDTQDKVFDIDALKKQLMEHDFKVAILANWNSAEPQWGYYNSILCTVASQKNVKNINDLHFLVKDTNYDSTSGTPTRGSVYGFLWGSGTTASRDGYLGVKTQWVESRSPEKGISDRESAEDWIRKNWDPSNDANNYPPYSDLWMLWNFDGGYYADNYGTPRASYTGTFAKQWADRNYSDFYYWLNLGNPNLTGNFFATTEGYQTGGRENGTYKDAGEFKFYGGNDTFYREKDGRRGIVLPAISNETEKKADGTDKYKDDRANVQSVIKFCYPATGKMWVKWGSYDGRSAKITIEKRNKMDQIIYQESKNPNSTTASLETYEWALSVTEDAQYISIYCTNGQAIIYEIEYIAEKYLYDTDRRGILPSEDHPIPMYGVQNFSKLENWKPGSTFDLSHDNRGEDGDGENGKHEDYEVKHIPLLRSVAKVEIYLPEYGGRSPMHVYMRSMNRTSRCEPMDVETPTETLWLNDDHDLSVSTAGPCEWYTIQQHGPFFEANNGKADNTTSNDITTKYQNKLAWLYGSWLSAKWTNGGTSGWTFGKTADGKTVNPTKKSNNEQYPRLFNPSIDRSDYTEMIEVPNDRSDLVNYHKYILYMPDKNIDDPNTVGVVNSVTKVAHIEYRYDNTVNLDDDNCFRVYFTNYGSGYQPNSKIATIDKDDYDNNDNYEMYYDYIKLHWPVMRNHVYTFIVGATSTRSEGEEGGAPMVVSSKVTTFSGVPVVE